MKKITKLTAALILLFQFATSAQTGVKVTYYDGSEQTINVAAEGKLYFSGDNLVIKPDASATITTLPVSIIRKLNFVAAVVAVDLANFRVSSGNCAAGVNWESANEDNFSHYELQYGSSATALEKSNRVEAKGSNSSYSLILPNLNGKYFYRLKMVDADGSVKYSGIASNQISCAENSNVTVYPNPASSVIRFNTSLSGNITVKIFNTQGRLVKQGIYRATDAVNISDLANGMYLIQINGITTKLIKQ